MWIPLSPLILGSGTGAVLVASYSCALHAARQLPNFQDDVKTYSLISSLWTAAFATPRAENAKINVTDEPYFGTQIVCNYLPFSKAAKGAQGGPQQYATFERKHSPTEK